MIVDKIYAHDQKKVIELAQDVEKHYEDVWRASSAGKCVRRLIFQKLKIPGAPMQPRSMRVFAAGNDSNERYRKLTEEVLPGQVGEAESEIALEIIPGITLTGHIDHLLTDPMLGYIVVERKSMSDFAYRRLTQGVVDHDYVCQAGIYKKALNTEGVLFFGERKETSHLAEVLFHDSIEAVSKYGIEDEYVEVSAPFEDVIPELQAKYTIIKNATRQEDAFERPEPVDHYACHNCDGTGTKEYKVRGKDEYETKECKICLGSTLDPEPRLSYPCGSYCPFTAVCYPTAVMTFEGGKPVYRLEPK